MPGHHFISYSSADGAELALQLCDKLTAGPPSLPAWLDKRQLQPGDDWDSQILDAIKSCASLLFVMTRDSVEDTSVCKHEWVSALKYKKPIVPIRLHPDAELPFRLGSRQYIDFTGPFEPALARLRQHLQWLASPAGTLRALKDRLADAQRDLRRAADATEQARIEAEIALLRQQIVEQEQVVNNPAGAAERVAASIAAGLERERKPEKPIGGESRTKFINPPPGIAPAYFQNRHVELKLIGDFLMDESRRLITVVGRAGIGKTAMVCLLLKALESGQLPHDGGALRVGGIVYLSAVGTRRVSFPNLFADLCKLLPDATARELDALFKQPQVSTAAKTRALLAAFPPSDPVVALLDNFEDLVDPATLAVSDAELDEALRALLDAPAHAVKLILTTRVAPRELALAQPGRQARIELGAGLEWPYAENILREMDADGTLGLKNASAELLAAAREYTRGYPRALEALFGLLFADRYTTLREILDCPPPDNIVEVLVGEAFNRLDPAARQVIQALAVYARPVTSAAVDYLLQPYLSGVNSAPVLNRLVSMHFARREAGRYYLHPVDQAYALQHIPPGEKPKQDKTESPSRLANFWQRLLNFGKNARDNSPPPPSWTQFTLLHRGAEYFKQARTPREEWKTIDDLAPQLAEFDLRCAAREYDAAANVLLDIDYEYLLLWGHVRLVVGLHEHLLNKVNDPELRQGCLGSLGLCYGDLGQTAKAIDYHEQALVIDRAIGNQQGEGVDLGNLGNCYADLGQTAKAIEYYEQALAIAREVGDQLEEGHDYIRLANRYSDLGKIEKAIRYHEEGLAIYREIGSKYGESIALGNLGNCYTNLGEITKAIEYYEQALAIDREIGYRRGEGIQLGNLASCYADLGEITKAIEYYEQALAIDREIGYRWGEGQDLGNLTGMLIEQGCCAEAIQYALESVKIAAEINSPNLSSSNNTYLALAYLFAGEPAAARTAAEAAVQYDIPDNNHSSHSLFGLTALRQRDRAAAQEAFTAAVGQADALLVQTPQYYSALDSKALALCGLALLEGPQHIPEAIAVYRAARAITTAPGIVARVLRLFDALVVVDTGGILAPVRAAAAGDQE